jgi:predicted PurR-regulated permease PerM
VLTGRPYCDAVDTSDTDQPSPSLFQRKVLWGAVTGLSIVLIGAVGVFLIWLGMRVLVFLQPVLVPLAVAGIIAYLLEPLIRKLTDRGAPRMRAMLIIFTAFHLMIVLLATMVVVPAVRQSTRWFENREVADLIENVRSFSDRAFGSIDRFWERFSLNQPAAAETPSAVTPPVPAAVVPAEPPPPPDVAAAPSAEPPAISPAAATTGEAEVSPSLDPEAAATGFSSRQWLRANTQVLMKKVGIFAASGFTGFLGLAGYIVGFFLVPLYLYYFLKESDTIKRTWSDYLPLTESQFKSEVVSTLTEINGYLIAFFRGQMLVSLIDGLLVGLCLKLIGLPGGLLIGIFVALLGLLPYVGSLVCWIPAVLIAISHFGQSAPGPGGVPGANILDPSTGAVVRHYVNTWSLFPDQIWVYPLIVSAIFVVVQQVNSFVTQPKIVGDSVGLHPLTVIFSVLFWSLLIGGFLGVLLAVPLTASLKVLFRRYIWEKRLHQATAAAHAAANGEPEPAAG